MGVGTRRHSERSKRKTETETKKEKPEQDDKNINRKVKCTPCSKIPANKIGEGRTIDLASGYRSALYIQHVVILGKKKVTNHVRQRGEDMTGGETGVRTLAY